MSGRAAAEKVAKGWGDQLPRFDADTEAWLNGLSRPAMLRHLRRVLATLTMIEKDIADAPAAPVLVENAP